MPMLAICWLSSAMIAVDGIRCSEMNSEGIKDGVLGDF